MRHLWRLPRRGLIIVALAVGVSVASAAPAEYQVKAVFLFNFAQFVDWPPDAFAGPAAPFVIGVLGEDPFGGRLDEIVRGEQVNGRALVTERYRSVSEIHNCHVLFIGKQDSGRLSEILAALKGRSILTVSDADADGPRGVMIGLLNQNSRIRLRIDVGAVKAANLTVSSKLLRPAEIVGGSGE